ncbi:MAG: hypothetical protein IPI12_01990 [Ignavibacteriales bacterium]|nr:hypothetical protein [Ignavibacteriales bacterium]
MKHKIPSHKASVGGSKNERLGRKVAERHREFGDPKFIGFGMISDDRKKTPNEIKDFFLTEDKNTSIILM